MNNIKNKLKLYIKENLLEEKHFKGFSTRIGKLKNIFLEEDYDYDFLETPKLCNEENIKDYIDKHEDYNDFQTILFKLIDNRNLKDSDVYNKVHIDRRLFSKIRSDKEYHPSKETIILLAIALELSETELDNLLESASYSLPKNNNYDLIIRFCFINKIFKLKDINELLNEYKCKLFNY